MYRYQPLLFSLLRLWKNWKNNSLKLFCTIALLFCAGCGTVSASGNTQGSTTLIHNTPLTQAQQTYLRQVARETWQFFEADVDPVTHLPRNNITSSGPTSASNYTSGTEIGAYLWSIVAARDLGVINASEAEGIARNELETLKRLQTYHGWLLRWYSTATAQPVQGPSGKPLTDGGFVSTVDDSWYAAGLLIAQQAFPDLAEDFGRLLHAMNYSLLYDSSVNQLYIGYRVGKGPTKGHYALLYGGTRIADEMAIASGTVPGSLWWGLATTPPAGKKQAQQPQGQNITYTDPQTGKSYTVFEGHYTYDGIQFVPTWAGSAFQAFAPALLVPETSWGPQGLGMNDANTVQAQIAYATQTLHYSIWGLAPASTPQRLNGYAQYGAAGLAIKTGKIPDNAVTPYASFATLALAPQQAYTNIQLLATRYHCDSAKGFFDSVDPTTGQVSGRYMDVSQAVILAGIDDALNNNRLQSYFAQSDSGQRLKPYVALERFLLQPANLVSVPASSSVGTPLPISGTRHTRGTRKAKH